MIDIEVCINTDDLNSLASQVSSAKEGGAARIEICARMDLDGLTPSVRAMEIAREAFSDVKGLMVMVRPRSGGFCYSGAEIEQMIQSINCAGQVGADGVVFGVLNRAGEIDVEALELLVEAARNNQLKITFHRGFDALNNPKAGIELIDLQGVGRILTAGSAWNTNKGALDGLANLRAYLDQISGRMELIVGGGINAENVPKLVQELAVDSQLNYQQFSFHSYSAVLTDWQVDSHKVAELHRVANCLESVA